MNEATKSPTTVVVTPCPVQVVGFISFISCFRWLLTPLCVLTDPCRRGKYTQKWLPDLVLAMAGFNGLMPQHTCHFMVQGDGDSVHVDHPH